MADAKKLNYHIAFFEDGTKVVYGAKSIPASNKFAVLEANHYNTRVVDILYISKEEARQMGLSYSRGSINLSAEFEPYKILKGTYLHSK